MSNYGRSNSNNQRSLLKVLVVGLNPSKKGGASLTIKRLYEWLSFIEIGIVSFTNLYESYEIKGQTLSSSFIKDISRDYDKIICLGDMVKTHLLRMDIDHGYLPHPSGLNRKLNDPKYVHKTLEACKNYLYER